MKMKNTNKIDQELSLEIPNNGGNHDLEIVDNSPFNIKIKGNPTTGFIWLLSNVDELTSTTVIEPLNLDEQNGSKDFISNDRTGQLCGAGGSFIFKFKANNASGKELPKLKFIYKRPWETKEPHSNAEVTLKVGCKICNEITLPQNATEGEIKIKENEPFSIKIKGNPTTGYSWFLKNEEEITQAGITPLNLNEHKSGSYISHNPKGMCGGGGIFDFQFNISKINNELPSLKFIYRRPWIPENDDDFKLDVKLVN